MIFKIALFSILFYSAAFGPAQLQPDGNNISRIHGPILQYETTIHIDGLISSSVSMFDGHLFFITENDSQYFINNFDGNNTLSIECPFASRFPIIFYGAFFLGNSVVYFFSFTDESTDVPILELYGLVYNITESSIEYYDLGPSPGIFMQAYQPNSDENRFIVFGYKQPESKSTNVTTVEYSSNALAVKDRQAFKGLVPNAIFSVVSPNHIVAPLFTDDSMVDYLIYATDNFALHNTLSLDLNDIGNSNMAIFNDNLYLVVGEDLMKLDLNDRSGLEYVTTINGTMVSNMIIRDNEILYIVQSDESCYLVHDYYGQQVMLKINDVGRRNLITSFADGSLGIISGNKAAIVSSENFSDAEWIALPLLEGWVSGMEFLFMRFVENESYICIVGLDCIVMYKFSTSS